MIEWLNINGMTDVRPTVPSIQGPKRLWSSICLWRSTLCCLFPTSRSSLLCTAEWKGPWSSPSGWYPRWLPGGSMSSVPWPDSSQFGGFWIRMGCLSMQSKEARIFQLSLVLNRAYFQGVLYISIQRNMLSYLLLRLHQIYIYLKEKPRVPCINSRKAVPIG